MIVNGVTDMSLAEMGQNVSKEDFKLIAIEECAELQKALIKISRGYNSVEDYDELLDTLADNLLATQYLISSLGVEKEVSDTIKKKHSRNYNNAMLGNFVYRDKLPNEIELSDKICLALETQNKVFFALTSSYGINVEKDNEKYYLSIREYSIKDDMKLKIGATVYELFDVTSSVYLKDSIQKLIKSYKHFKF